MRAPMGEQWQQLAYVAADYGEFGLAREAIDLLVQGLGGSHAARYRQAEFLVDIGSLGEGLDLISALPDGEPEPFFHALTRGTLSATAGQSDSARTWLERAIDLRPRSGVAWHTLSKVTDFTREPRLYDRLVRLRDQIETAGTHDFAFYHYALGKAYADCGEHALAFEATAIGAREIRSDFPYSREADAHEATDAVRGYDSRGIAGLANLQSEPTARTIFVLGSPRSGTTLVEQILTAHGQVSDGGEINLLRLLARESGGISRAELDAYVAREGAASLAQLWHHWLDERFGPHGRVVDKTHLNSRNLGLIASVLPEAPILWLKRDPLDCAWSCFRTGFLGSVPWAYDLEDIAFHFRLEDQLLAKWQAILGERLLVVPYDALVGEPVGWIRRMLSHCGLSEEPQVFAPHENRRVVTTSSALQVREPINLKGIGTAEPYREFLKPFEETYYT